MKRLAFAVAIVLSTLALSSSKGEATTGQSPGGAAVYADVCTRCHDAPESRVPSRDALKARTPEAILLALTSGSMTLQAITLSAADKRAVAEYLADKPFDASSASPPAGMCSRRPTNQVGCSR